MRVVIHVPFGATDVGINTYPTKSSVRNWGTWLFFSPFPIPANVLLKSPSIYDLGHTSNRNVQC